MTLGGPGTAASERIAWTQRGRHHALKGIDRTPPEEKKPKRWYLDGYAVGKRDRIRREAEGLTIE